jgi:hypothetical protein
MKSRSSKILLFLLLSAGVIAWNTPQSGDPAANEDLLMGTSNTTASAVGQMGVIGSSNQIKGRSVLVVGDSNELTKDAGSATDELKWSLVVGTGNKVSKGAGGGRGRNIIGGDLNTIDGTNCLVSGYANTLNPGGPGTVCYHSAAIGNSNHINSDRGWAIGSINEVTGLRGVAFGTGSEAKNTESMALGRYNEEMAANDVVVIGTGTSDTVRNTALRATADGSVILGSATSGTVVLAKAQGDISMGAYSN